MVNIQRPSYGDSAADSNHRTAQDSGKMHPLERPIKKKPGEYAAKGQNCRGN